MLRGCPVKTNPRGVLVFKGDINRDLSSLACSIPLSLDFANPVVHIVIRDIQGGRFDVYFVDQATHVAPLAFPTTPPGIYVGKIRINTKFVKYQTAQV